MKIKRGDIFLADLGEGYGSEQGGIRPVLVVQNKYAFTYFVSCLYNQQGSFKTLSANTLHYT